MYILAFIIALLASWVLTPYVKKLAFRIGALDKPDGRKVHHGIMPRLGGLAIYLAFVIAVLATMHMTRDIFALLLGGTVIVIVGILDDKYQLPAKVKLLGQIAAAFVLVLFDIKIEWLNNPWGGYFYLEYFSVPLWRSSCTSSKISVATWSCWAKTFFSASIIRASSPPEATLFMGFRASPTLADM